MSITKEHMSLLLKQYKTKNTVPFIIEVLGTPNAGKTSAIQTFEKILKRNGVKHKIIYEAASRCKIKNKLSPDFNLWTLSETIKQLLEVYSGNYDIVICERGLLDTICWCELYYQDNIISKDEHQKLLDYILLNRFISHIGCCYIMECSVEASLERENLSGLLDVTGTIVNEVVLSKYNTSLERAKQLYSKYFKMLMTLDTSILSQSEINKSFISSILGYIETLCTNKN